MCISYAIKKNGHMSFLYISLKELPQTSFG